MLPVSNGIDWRYLGYDGDPVPGCPDTIEEGAAAYKKTAQDLSSGARALTTMVDSTEAIVMKTMDAIREDSDQVRAGMSELVGRYSMAHAALRDYGPALRKAQDQARAAAADAIEAKRRYSMHVEEVQAQRRAMLSFEADQRIRAVEQAQMATTRANAANADLQAAHDRIAAAIAQRDEAGDQAAQRIETGDELCALQDSWQDRAQEVVALGLANLGAAGKAVVQGIIDVGKFVWEHIDEISLALDVIAITLSIAALAFPPLAAAALAVKGVGLLIAGFKAAQLVARVASIAKSSVGVYQDAQNGEGGKVAVGVIAIAATSFLAFSRVGSKPISVIRGKQWLDGATKATAQQLFRSHPIAFTTLAAEHSFRAQFGPKVAIDAMKFVGELAIENGAEHVKHSLSSPRRVEPCLTN